MSDSPRPTLLDLGRDSTPSSAITILEPSNPAASSSAASLTPEDQPKPAVSRSPDDPYTPKNPMHAKVHHMSSAHAEQSQFNSGLDSPCFVHSYLDKGVTLWDTLKKQKRQMSKDSKARSDSSRRRHQDGENSDSSQTPLPTDIIDAPGSSYFDSSKHPNGLSSAIDTQPGSGHGKTDDEMQSGSDTSTVAQRKKVALKLQSEDSDDGASLSERSSSYDSSYSYSSGDEDDKVRSLTRQLAETAVGVREMSKQLGRARVKSTIQSVLIITKARDNQLIKLTRELAIWLMTTPRNGKDTGLIVYVDSQLKQSKRFDAEGIKRDYPRLFEARPRRTPSASSSMSSASGYESSNGFGRQEGQLRYWTSDMCSRSPHLFDFVVTLGGDGTVLFCSWLFQRIVPPVLPFALGSLGFLTNFDFADYEHVMKSTLEDGIRVNLRMRFTATVYRATLPTTQHAERSKRRAIRSGKTGEIIMRSVRNCGWDAIESSGPGGDEDSRRASGNEPAPDTPKKKKKKGCRDREVMCFSTRPVETFEVLNDLVVDRGPSPYVSQLELFGDEHHMTTAQADGICISTPTGSTAYSLSAGGSLVHPEIPAILITPICPHTLSFRPMLLPDSMELRIAVPYNSRSTAWASFDGRGRVELKQGDHIKVTASRYPFPTVCAEDQSVDWFSSISRTLKWNERQRQKSFVVVEEGGESSSKNGQRKKEGMTFSKSVADDDDDDSDEEEETDENDEEEEEAEHFDIDDTSTTVTRSNSPSQSHPGTPGELHRRRSSNHSHSHSKAGSVGSGSRKSSSGGILPTNSNGVPRLTALTPSHPPSSRHDPLLNSPDRFGIQGPPLPPKAISERHMLSADFRLDDDGATERRHLQRAENSKARDRTPTRKEQRRKKAGESYEPGSGTALVVYGDDESDSDSTTGA